jgi:hypothetical protein
MKVGDIWLDTYGDYYLITECHKENMRSKTQKFYIFFSAILLTANGIIEGDSDLYTPGQLLDDVNPLIMKHKVA